MVVAVATPRDLIAALPRNLDDEGRHDRVRQFFASGAGARVKKATAFWRLWCIVELAAAVQAEVPVIVKMGIARRDALDVGLALHRLRQQSKVGAAAPTAIQLAEPGLEAMRRDIWSIHGADEPSPLDDVNRGDPGDGEAEIVRVQLGVQQGLEGHHLPQAAQEGVQRAADAVGKEVLADEGDVLLEVAGGHGPRDAAGA